MNKLILGAGLLISPLAFSCPDLGGHYVSMDGQTSMNIQMSGSKMIWGEGADPMILDGQPHTTGPATVTATCKDSDIIIKIQAEGRVINVTITKTATGYKFVSDDANTPSAEYKKVN